jgi:hypothetical protein
MHSHAPRFDNPQFVSHRPFAQHANKVANTRKNHIGLRLQRRFQNDDTCGLFGREPQHVSEVMVQCYQGTFLACTP